MKHSWLVTAILAAMFFTAQMIGLGTAAYAYSAAETADVAEPTGVGERPDTTPWGSIALLLAGIAISTTLILYLAKTNKAWLWKAWFTAASFIALYLFFSVYVAELAAAIIAGGLALLRSQYKSSVTHNLVELLMYAGIALFLAPLFSVNAAAALLLIMSAYDAYAVWHSQHMVTLANFTRSSKTFPGLNLAPASTEVPEENDDEAGTSTGVLGGGDILFPLLFALTVFFAAAAETTLRTALLYGSMIAVSATAALLVLFYASRKNAYYPALPFLTAGCYVGIIAVRTIHAF